MQAANKTKNKELGEVLSELVSKRFKDAFLIEGASGEKYSYGEFFSAALDAADAFKAHGMKPRAIVTMVMRNSAQTLVLYLGAMLAGVRIALVDPEKGVEDMHAIFKQVDSHATIADVPSRAFGRDYVPTDVFVRSFPGKKRSQKDIVKALRALKDDSPFLITFTSGSTGVPKGVSHSPRNLYLSSKAFGERFDLGPKHTFYHHLPMTYVAGVLNSFILPLVHGSKLVVGPRFSVGGIPQFWEIPIKHKVNVFWLVPTMLSLLMKLDRGSAGIEYAKKTKIIGCVGTAPLSPTLHKEFEKRYALPLFESYGLSETLFVTSQGPKENDPIESVGKPLSMTDVRLGEDGELLVSVPWMFKGYLIEKKEIPFKGKDFVSGDLGTFDKGGSLRITGRKKDIVIRGGINLSPRHIEEYLSERKVFDEQVILGFPDDILGEKIVCFYVPHPTGFTSEERSGLLSDMKQALGKEYGIDEFAELSAIPKNTNGKVDAPKLRASYKSS